MTDHWQSKEKKPLGSLRSWAQCSRHLSINISYQLSIVTLHCDDRSLCYNALPCCTKMRQPNDKQEKVTVMESEVLCPRSHEKP